MDPNRRDATTDTLSSALIAPIRIVKSKLLFKRHNIYIYWDKIYLELIVSTVSTVPRSIENYRHLENAKMLSYLVSWSSRCKYMYLNSSGVDKIWRSQFFSNLDWVHSSFLGDWFWHWKRLTPLDSSSTFVLHFSWNVFSSAFQLDFEASLPLCPTSWDF